MKKIFIIGLLLILVSCSKSNTIDIKTNNNQITNPIKTSNINTENKKKTISDLENYLKIISSQNIELNSKLICGNYFFENNMMDDETKKLGKDFLEKCEKIKKEAQEKLDKKISEFKLEDCRKNITAKYPDLDKTNLEGQINICEIYFGLKNGCEKLIDTEKIKNCNEIKDFQAKVNFINTLNNTDITQFIN